MTTKAVDVHEVQSNLEKLLSLVRQGNEIILTQDSTPLARLVPIETSSSPRKAGLHRGAICASEDFDEPLPEEFWAGNQ